MALSQRIRDIHSVVAPHIVGRGIDTYDVLALLSALDDFIDGEAARAVAQSKHEASNDPQRLHDLIVGSDVVQAYIFHGQTILAIKELRALSKGGLKECKDAVQAFRVPEDFPSTYRDPLTRVIRWDFSGQEVTDTNRPLDPPF